jgi:hypothetical protein
MRHFPTLYKRREKLDRTDKRDRTERRERERVKGTAWIRTGQGTGLKGLDRRFSESGLN